MENEIPIIKEKIILNNEYKNWMIKISQIEKEFALSSDFNNKVALDHGIEHMNRVANNVYRLLKEYAIQEETCVLGYIAGLIHDIGMIYGKDGHAYNGAEMASDFLKKLNLIDINDIPIITNAIKNHSNGGNNPDVITSILTIADKADMCKQRSLGNKSPIQFIKDYRIEIKNGILQINYIINNLNGIEGLYIIPKSIDIPRELGKKLGLKVEFYINGKYEEFKDRQNYKGKTYQRKDKLKTSNL